MSDIQRDAFGRVKAGSSLNPKGKPKGTLSAAGRMRVALADHLPDILTSVVEQAKAGDLQAARIILERVLPPLRAEAASISLTALENAASLTEKADAILCAAAAGELPADTAASLIGSLAGIGRLKEVDELMARVALLEERYA